MHFALLGLTAETSLHPGTGRRTGVIDLPIMREAHTHWPCIYGSAVKGAMRSQARRMGKDWITDVFGPDTDRAHEHAGALAVGDARLLLLPVRSLSSHFKWVTCPDLLRRAASDARRLGLKAIDLGPAHARIKDDQVLMPAASGAAPAQQLFLEEFGFQIQRTDLSALLGWLSSFGSEPKGFEEWLKDQLAIVSDDMFAHLATHATPVTPHIAIEHDRKVVKDGALWYEETLPPETVLYVTLAAHPSRRADSRSGSDLVLRQTLELFPADRPYLQVGGNETVGMGWCRVSTVQSNLEG
ncbi:type III-B CRISPR module RAMP protein Cmr4 [Sphaerotilus uruguayifluvii]|uniref:CRISPR-associated protein Cmr4 n=1 Tax=Sphaerotilus uruguayifluvii TaxID=2735897 RepID=A0ABX2G6Y0_9BURK|nr:type III-B CRISPR module RAMP protein Cmr4 [Leptothrix sp. C29]NRT58054.1 CRISPR-associated protein Cmr4 [Leptothrix sp. C29]